MKPSGAITYESAWAELQQIVRALQEETVGIDELTVKIGRANELVRFCRERLRQVETTVDQLTQADPPPGQPE